MDLNLSEPKSVRWAENEESTYDLLSFFKASELSIPIIHRNRDISAEFRQDLSSAGYTAVAEFLKKARGSSGRENLFAAIDGRNATDRSPQEVGRLLVFADDLSVAMKNPETLFVATTAYRRGIKSKTVQIDESCACVVSKMGDYILVSSDLGFRDLLVVAQLGLSGMVATLVNRSGISLNPRKIFENMNGFQECRQCELFPSIAMSKTKILKGDKCLNGFIASVHR